MWERLRVVRSSSRGGGGGGSCVERTPRLFFVTTSVRRKIAHTSPPGRAGRGLVARVWRMPSPPLSLPFCRTV